jgi:hypothetical protein
MTNGKLNGHDTNTTRSLAIPWPAPINETGMYGISGEFVRLVEPHTEGDRNVILLAFLTCAGNLLGREFFIATGADRQCGNLYLCAVGATGTGRKGSAISAAETFFTYGSRAPHLPKIIYGVSSGEGVIAQVRDRRVKQEFNKKTGKVDETVIDAGVEDKRVLFCLSEFQQYIAAMRRQDSILASVIRQAWDKGAIASPSKNNEVVATAALISIIGLISKEELLVETTDTDAHNGTLNRFLFACSQRSRLLPEGGEFESLYETREWTELQSQFNRNIANSAGASLRLERDSDTQDEWGRNHCPDRGLYKILSEPRPGLWGAITARAAQQLIRLSLIIAIINGHRRIQAEDQSAAYEIWRYCDDSSKYIFGNRRLDDPRAIRILVVLREAGTAGLSRRELHGLTHHPAEEINQSLTWLAEAGIIYCRRTESTGGRPEERWFASL